MLGGRSEQPNPLGLTAMIDLFLRDSKTGENRSTERTQSNGMHIHGTRDA